MNARRRLHDKWDGTPPSPQPPSPDPPQQPGETAVIAGQQAIIEQHMLVEPMQQQEIEYQEAIASVTEQQLVLTAEQQQEQLDDSLATVENVINNDVAETNEQLQQQQQQQQQVDMATHQHQYSLTSL